MPPDDISSLFQRIRKACPTPVWSQGTKLYQMEVVEGISEDAEEIVLRLHLPGSIRAPTVVLYPEDDDWECDCDHRAPVCAHVAAAVIAVSHAGAGSGPPKPARRGPRLAYRFSRHPRGPGLKRMFLLDDREAPLTVPLMAGVAKRSFPFGFHPTNGDLEVDRLVGRALDRPLPLGPEAMGELLAALAGLENVSLDGQPVEVADTALFPEASLQDDGKDAISLSIESPNDHLEVLGPGVGCVGDTLYALAEPALTGPRWEKLPIHAVYTQKDIAELVATVVPELEKRISVDIYTTRLPERLRFMTPRLILSADTRGAAVSVLPRLVYGDPPHVRIVDDKMQYLEGGVPFRDRRAEQRLIDALRDELNLVLNRRVTVSGKEASRFLERLQIFSRDTLDRTQQLLGDAEPLIPHLEVADDVVRLTFDTAGQNGDAAGQRRSADPRNVLDAWREGLSAAPLDGGGWAPIPREWLDRYGHLVQDLLAARRADDRVAPAAIPQLSTLCEALDLPRQPCFDRLRPLIDGFDAIPEATLPAGFHGALRSYQSRGVDWLSFLRTAGLGGILADDMGLGKTVQTLAAIGGRTLVVAPTSVMDNWILEAGTFRPDLKVCRFHGPKRALDAEADLVVTTYALLRIDLAKIAAIEWDAVVLDEAQHIKNPASQAAKAAFKLRGDFFLALSGTPVENRLDELWSLFYFCNRGLLGGRADFQKHLADPIALGDAEATRRLRDRIAPFVLRRLKREVAPELPPRVEQVLHCELSDEERAVYDAVRTATRKQVVERLEKGAGVMAALEALLRLRQTACHAGLVPGQVLETSSKITLLGERLAIAVESGHKALVFSQWTSLLDLIEPELENAGIDYTRLDGATRDRGSVVATFQRPDGPPVMLISLKAGGTGLNLTEADHVFLVDPWWNPAAEDQAADRTHRIGQDKPVNIYRLVTKDTVEERVMSLQIRKRRLADAALGETDRALSLTRDDLLSLLEP